MTKMQASGDVDWPDRAEGRRFWVTAPPEAILSDLNDMANRLRAIHHQEFKARRANWLATASLQATA